MTSIRLQKLQLSDFDDCWSILASWPDVEREYNGFGQSQDTLRAFMKDYDGYCAHLERMKIGFCLLRKTSDIAEILLLAVDHQSSGQGWGSKMLVAVIDDLQKQHFSEVWLEVHVANTRALALYQKAGFEITSRRAKYYPDGADALNLKLAFKTSAC